MHVEHSPFSPSRMPSSGTKPPETLPTFSLPVSSESVLPDTLKRPKGGPIQDSFVSIASQDPIRETDRNTLVPRPEKPVFGPPLTNTQLHATGLDTLLTSLQTKSFQGNALFLAQNQLTDADALALFKQLQHDQSIQHLVLSRNQLTTFAMAGLADLLKVNHFIGWVILSHNKLGDNGLKTLAPALQDNPTVQHLILSDNFIGDAGAIALFEALEHNTALKSIVLSNNGLTDASVPHLIRLLQVHPTLYKLDLQNNKLSDAMKSALKEAVSNKPGMILAV